MWNSTSKRMFHRGTIINRNSLKFYFNENTHTPETRTLSKYSHSHLSGKFHMKNISSCFLSDSHSVWSQTSLFILSLSGAVFFTLVAVCFIVTLWPAINISFWLQLYLCWLFWTLFIYVHELSPRISSVSKNEV